MTKREFLVLAVVGGAAAFVFMPTVVMPSIQRKAQLNKSLNHARSLSLALRVYAGDHRGAYPNGSDANQCLAQLIDEIATEKIFYVAGSAWHGQREFQQGPDNRWETSDPPGIALEPGENAFAYNSAANLESREDMPLMASGFSEEVGTYSANMNQLGGVWAKARKCVVTYTDGSGDTPPLDKNRQLIRDGQNVFLAPGCQMQNPAAP